MGCAAQNTVQQKSVLCEIIFFYTKMLCTQYMVQVVSGCANMHMYWYRCKTGSCVHTWVLAEKKKITHWTWAFPRLTCPLAICFSPWLQTSVYWWYLKHQRTETGVTVNKKKISMFLMSFSLVYCSFSKSCLRIQVAKSPPQRYIL